MSEDFVLQQYEFELGSWSRILLFIAQENIHYKTRLSQVVNSEQLETDLPKLEYFNEEFISQDKILEFLNAEVKKHQKLLAGGTTAIKPFLQIKHNQDKLRREVKVEEELFQHLKDEFAGYLNACTQMKAV